MLFYKSALLSRRVVAASSGGAQGVRKRALLSSSASRSEDERQRGRRDEQPPLPETEDPFVILNVKVDATEAEIKTSFYQLAKQVHPDAAAQTHRTDALKAAADFHKLMRAYETLMDPTKRAEYILKRRHYSRNGTSASAAAAAAAAVAGFSDQSSRDPNPVDAFNASLRKGRRRSARRRAGMYNAIHEGEHDCEDENEEGRRRAGIAHAAARGAKPWDALTLSDPGLFGQLQESFHDALIYSYLGPRVAENTIPWAFEGEERRSRGRVTEERGAEIGKEGQESLHPHILEMTSGQQLLGFVDAAPLSIESLLEAGREGKKEGEKEKQGVEEEEGLSLRSQLSGLISATDRKNYMPLRLVWQGRCLARSTRLRDPVEGEDVVVVQTYLEGEVQHQHQHQQQEQRGKCYVIRGLESKRLLSSHQVRDAATGGLTHVLVSHRTPLVSHLHLLQAEGGVECRVTKGDLQSYIPSEYWRFPPRSQDHDVGSWYIERADPTAPGRNGGRSVAATRIEKLLPPAVIVLVCAFKTLDKEVIEEEKRQRSSKLKETVKGWVGKML
ncbi:chaperone domain superfamily isoform 2 [Nannochloropsis oceanica]